MKKLKRNEKTKKVDKYMLAKVTEVKRKIDAVYGGYKASYIIGQLWASLSVEEQELYSIIESLEKEKIELYNAILSGEVAEGANKSEVRNEQ